MKVTFFINLFVFLSICCNAQNSLSNKLTTEKESVKKCFYPVEILNFMSEIGMKPIRDENLLKSRVIGGKGLPYLFDVSYEVSQKINRVPASILFWAEKNNVEYLVFAIDDFSNKEKFNYKVIDSISMQRFLEIDYPLKANDGDYLSYGLTAYEGILGVDKDLSYFHLLGNENLKGPKDIYPIASNGFVPVIDTTENGTGILYRYKGQWYKYEEVDW